MPRQKPDDDLADGGAVPGKKNTTVGEHGLEPIVPLPAGEEPPVEGLVKARWIDTNPTGVFNPEQGLIRYGDPFWVTDEQLDQDPRLDPFHKPFTPDPAVVAEIDDYDKLTGAAGEED